MLKLERQRSTIREWLAQHAREDPVHYREIAEAHWKYTARLLELAGHNPTELEKYLYIEAMLHGAKHERNDK